MAIFQRFDDLIDDSPIRDLHHLTLRRPTCSSTATSKDAKVVMQLAVIYEPLDTVKLAESGSSKP